MRRAPSVRLAPTERATLERWVEDGPAAARRAVRARIVLEAAEGRPNSEIARSVGVHPETVARWRDRFVVNRLEGLPRGAPRGGTRAKSRSDVVGRILSITLDGPPGAGIPWTTRTLARSLGVNHMLVHRVWKAHGVVPPSDRPTPEPTRHVPVVEPLGLYLHPPAAALIFAVTERSITSEARAPDPAGFPPSGSGASELVESVAMAEEIVPPTTTGERSARELRVFLRALEDRAPAGAQLNVLFDRPLEYLPESVVAWLDGHRRFRVYATPTGQRWAKVVEAWLQRWTRGPVHPESFSQTPSLVHWMNEAAIARPGRPRSPSWFGETSRPPWRLARAREGLGPR
jgi:transposase